MKKALSLAMAAAMTMGLAACGSTASSTAAADSTPAASTAESEETSAAESTDGKVYTCLFATSGHDRRAPVRHGADDGQPAAPCGNVTSVHMGGC